MRHWMHIRIFGVFAVAGSASSNVVSLPNLVDWGVLGPPWEKFENPDVYLRSFRPF